MYQDSGEPPIKGFDMLPPRYVERERARRAAFLWVTNLTALVSILVGINWISLNAHLNNVRQCERLAQASKPLIVIHSETVRLDDAHQRKTEWLTWVESARPDTGLLQVLGGVCDAAAQFPTDVEIASLDISMPTEGSADSDQSDAIKSGEIMIKAFASSIRAGRVFADAIQQSEWVESVELKVDPADLTRGVVHIVGKPSPARIAP